MFSPSIISNFQGPRKNTVMRNGSGLLIIVGEENITAEVCCTLKDDISKKGFLLSIFLECVDNKSIYIH